MFKFKSGKGHRADPFSFPLDLGGRQTNQTGCSECGFDLEPEARGRFRHLESRNGAAWLDSLKGLAQR